ncbi:protein-arginine deiminase family protein [Lentzea sp. NBRC 102530]|uniref:protein-arginine deiminase family protein n=1 Tax=Lentzea sp. NBRC 102530 TaxID=3032201 RepID=UPI002553BDCA|nr:protein-arginine deiminase family protein [Lentzea sp. NBRC 102530]
MKIKKASTRVLAIAMLMLTCQTVAAQADQQQVRLQADRKLFLANIDDDAGVCRERARTLVAEAVAREAAADQRYYQERKELQKLAETEPERAEREFRELERGHRLAQNQTDRDLAACNDAADEIVNGTRDEADLTGLSIAPVSTSEPGRLTVQGSENVRLFIKRAGAWEVVRPGEELSPAELEHGADLAIEGRDVVRDRAVWDGRVTVTLTVGGDSSSVQLHQAPVLTADNTLRLENVLISDRRANGQQQARFDQDVSSAVQANGVGFTRVSTGDDDKWMQDVLEPAYSSVPGPDGEPHGMRVLIQSTNDMHRKASRVAFTEFAGSDVAAIHIGHVPVPGENPSLDSAGNLETVPPTPQHPNGRIIVGAEEGKGPAAELLLLLRSQGAQQPIELDTSWLEIGHVDEFVQFLPVPGSRLGWRAIVADPRKGLRLLERLRDEHPDDVLHAGLPELTWPDDQHIDQRTIGEFLGDEQFLRTNDKAAAKIEANLAVLGDEVGLTEEDVVRIPSLFTYKTMTYKLLLSSINVMPAGEEKQKAEATLRAMDAAGAEIPNTVNGLVLNNNAYVAPQPFGPQVAGRDVFADAITDAFASTGYRVTYVDDIRYPHIEEGEIHCATNAFRALDRKWWS